MSIYEEASQKFCSRRKKVVQENGALLNAKGESDRMELLEACRDVKGLDSYIISFMLLLWMRIMRLRMFFGHIYSVHAYTIFSNVVYFDATYHSI